MSRETVVIGAGVVGLNCAYYLSKAGHRVTLIDRGPVGKGCSAENCGYVSPSHVLPLTTTGAMREAVMSLFKKEPALAVRFRLDPTMWAWMLNFAARCNRRDMMHAAVGINEILQSSRGLYDELIRDEGIECEWQAVGLLFVLESRAAFKKFGQTNKLLAEKFNVPAEPYEGDALCVLEPALKPGLAGAYLYDCDAHLRPDRFLAEMRRACESRGVAVFENREVKNVVNDGRRVRAVRTDAGDIDADAVVFATGAWTPKLARMIGSRVPIQPGKGYSVTMPTFAGAPKYPMIFEEHHVAVTPMKTGYRLGSTMEFAGYDEAVNPRRIELLKEGARHYLKDPGIGEEQSRWYGWRPMTYDSKPVIGRGPKWDNVYIAAGHNMLGLSMAPATGKLLTEIIDGKAPHLDPKAYSPARFV